MNHYPPTWFMCIWLHVSWVYGYMFHGYMATCFMCIWLHVSCVYGYMFHVYMATCFMCIWLHVSCVYGYMFHVYMATCFMCIWLHVSCVYGCMFHVYMATCFSVSCLFLLLSKGKVYSMLSKCIFIPFFLLLVSFSLDSSLCMSKVLLLMVFLKYMCSIWIFSSCIFGPVYLSF